MNSINDIHTTHFFIAVAYIQKSHRVNEPLNILCFCHATKKLPETWSVIDWHLRPKCRTLKYPCKDTVLLYTPLTNITFWGQDMLHGILMVNLSVPDISFYSCMKWSIYRRDLESEVMNSDNKTIGGSKGGARDAPGSKFFHFHAVFGKKIAK